MTTHQFSCLSHLSWPDNKHSISRESFQYRIWNCVRIQRKELLGTEMCKLPKKTLNLSRRRLPNRNRSERPLEVTLQQRIDEELLQEQIADMSLDTTSDSTTTRSRSSSTNSTPESLDASDNFRREETDGNNWTTYVTYVIMMIWRIYVIMFCIVIVLAFARVCRPGQTHWRSRKTIDIDQNESELR